MAVISPVTSPPVAALTLPLLEVTALVICPSAALLIAAGATPGTSMPANDDEEIASATGPAEPLSCPPDDSLDDEGAGAAEGGALGEVMTLSPPPCIFSV